MIAAREKRATSDTNTAPTNQPHESTKKKSVQDKLKGCVLFPFTMFNSSGKTDRQSLEDRRVFDFLKAVMISGLILIVLYAVTIDYKRTFEFASVGLMLAVAAACGGGLLGFLFGVPRSRQPASEMGNEEILSDQSRKLDENQTAMSNPNPSPRTDFLDNNNLRDISDWLSKIIIGVGLTEITSLPRALRSTGEYFQSGLGDKASGGQFAVAILLAYGTLGFLLGYLWTDLELKPLLARRNKRVRELEPKKS